MLDRRLMQDDNRGLGQGIKDNLVANEAFRLLLEKRFSASVNSVTYATNKFHSLLINSHQQRLCTPLFLLILLLIICFILYYCCFQEYPHWCQSYLLTVLSRALSHVIFIWSILEHCLPHSQQLLSLL